MRLRRSPLIIGGFARKNCGRWYDVVLLFARAFVFPASDWGFLVL